MKEKQQIEKVVLKEKFEAFTDHWSPHIVGKLNGQLVKVAKFKGSFVLHNHEGEDELFLVIKGKLFIDLPHGTLEVDEGEFVIVPKGVDHRPFAPEEAHVLLFEPASTLNTGNQTNALTKKELKVL